MTHLHCNRWNRDKKETFTRQSSVHKHVMISVTQSVSQSNRRWLDIFVTLYSTLTPHSLHVKWRGMLMRWAMTNKYNIQRTTHNAINAAEPVFLIEVLISESVSTQCPVSIASYMHKLNWDFVKKKKQNNSMEWFQWVILAIYWFYFLFLFFESDWWVIVILEIRALTLCMHLYF